MTGGRWIKIRQKEVTAKGGKTSKNKRDVQVLIK